MSTSATTTVELHVQGMTCGHCVSAITQEVSAIDGVCHVDVDLPNGTVTVASDAPLDPAALNAAIEDAGYSVAG